MNEEAELHPDVISVITEAHEATPNGWRYKSNRKLRTSSEIQQSVAVTLMQRNLVHLLAEVANIPAWLDANKPQPEQTNNGFVSPERFIEMCLTNHKIQISPNGARITRSMGGVVNKDLTPEELLLMIKSSLIDFNQLRDPRDRVKEKEVETKLYSFLMQCGHNELYRLGQQMYHDPKMIDTLDLWLEKMHSLFLIEEPMGVWKMMMKHMMWIIKRHMYSRKVVNDIWLQIFGKQGTGKSYVTKEVIFKPFQSLYCETELSKIEDFDREIEKFTKFLVVNFDEVALGQSNDPNYRIGKRQLNNLKSLLTRDKFTVRIMRTQKQAELAKTFTAFSSANTHLYDVIFDDTGMRRFFEFNSAQPFDTQYNHASVAELSAMSLDAWKGIDEDIEGGYWIKTGTEGQYVLEAQQSYFPTTSTVRLWVNEAKVVAGGTTLDEAYADYQSFCRDSGHNFIDTKQKFIGDMRILCKNLIDTHGMLKISYEG